MYDQDWINDGYGSHTGGGPFHKAETSPGNPLCGATFKYDSQYGSKTRVKWKKVTCENCLKLAPKSVREQRGFA